MAVDFFYPAYEVVRNQDRCITCRVCERQCANKVHQYDAELGLMISDESACVNCQRCVSLCPTRALKIVKTDNTFKDNVNYTAQAMTEIYRQAQSGGVLLSAMGNPAPLPVYWDKLLINASQVTNPSIDPLREPMETRVYLGSRPEGIRRDKDGRLIDDTPPQLKLEVPIMFSAMSYGSISYNAHESLARAAEKLGTYYNTGEGGLHQDFYKYGEHTIVQVASGRFGVNHDYLNAGAAIEIKMGQGAKPGIGGHLPGRKIVADIAKTRMIPEGSDAISPAPHHDIYSIEDLRQLVFSLKEASRYTKPVIVKIAAVHNVAAIASGIARSGADIIAIDGFRGGTGAAPTRIRDNVGIPIELALAAVDTRLRQEGIRDRVSLVVGGSIRSSADVVKAIALGADPILTIKVASHYAARYFLLNNKGAIAPGYLADFVVLDNLHDVNVEMVFKRGKLVYDGHDVEIAAPDIDPDILAGVLDTFHLPDVTPEQLRIGVAPLIGLIDGQIVTEDLGHAEGVDNGICQMTVCERHHDTGHVASCYVRGYGIQRGAVATSIAHDSHNIIACGVSPEDIAFAVNELKKMHGGIIVVENGQVQARLPLEVAGLFTDRPLPEVNEKLEHCKAAAWAQGVNRGIDPFMTLSFASLPVIPALRLTTKGVFNVNTLTFVE